MPFCPNICVLLKVLIFHFSWNCPPGPKNIKERKDGRVEHNSKENENACICQSEATVSPYFYYSFIRCGLRLACMHNKYLCERCNPKGEWNSMLRINLRLPFGYLSHTGCLKAEADNLLFFLFLVSASACSQYKGTYSQRLRCQEIDHWSQCHFLGINLWVSFPSRVAVNAWAHR